MSKVPDCKSYLEYLDKEMTIMGILSAVPLAAAGGALSIVLGKDGFGPEIWKWGHWSVIIASALCVTSAALFYKQRSLLAWFYGQLCLTRLRGEEGLIPQLLDGVDAWSSWVPYSWGFDALATGFVEYAAATIATLWLPRSKGLLWTFRAVPLALLVATAALQWYVFTSYEENDEPWSDWWNNEVRRPIPHKRVYARIMPSLRHGVGVFAIQPIPKGTYIFLPDDDPVVRVSASEFASAPERVKELYTDFCPEEDGVYKCPISFNKLTPAWFLNDSSEPNVAADSQLRFFALKDIQIGDELLADYNTYSGGVAWR